MKELTILFLVAMLFGVVSPVSANSMELRKGRVNPTSGVPGHTKSPEMPWLIDLTDNIITMSATPCDYTLNLYDEDGEVIYSVFVPAGTTQVVLPGTLSGSFELRFETDTYYYYGYIEL